MGFLFERLQTTLLRKAFILIQQFYHEPMERFIADLESSSTRAGF